MRGDAWRGRRLGQPGRMAAGSSPRRLAVSVVVGIVASLAVVVGPVATGPGSRRRRRFRPPAPPPSTYCDTIEPDGLAPADAGVVDPTDNPGGGDAVDVTVEVVDVETGAAVTEFSYLVSLDNTARGDDPEPERHPALHHMASQSPNVGRRRPGQRHFHRARRVPLPDQRAGAWLQAVGPAPRAAGARSGGPDGP